MLGDEVLTQKHVGYSPHADEVVSPHSYEIKTGRLIIIIIKNKLILQKTSWIFTKKGLMGINLVD